MTQLEDMPVYTDEKVALIKDSLTANPDSTFEVSGLSSAEFSGILGKLEPRIYDWNGYQGQNVETYTIKIKRKPLYQNA